MLIELEGMLLPHDTDKSLVKFLSSIVDSTDRYLITIQTPNTTYLYHNEGYVIKMSDGLLYYRSNSYANVRPVYLNAWNHIISMTPSNVKNKNCWAVKDIHEVLDKCTNVWPYYEKRINACLENSQQI